MGQRLATVRTAAGAAVERQQTRDGDPVLNSDLNSCAQRRRRCCRRLLVNKHTGRRSILTLIFLPVVLKTPTRVTRPVSYT